MYIDLIFLLNAAADWAALWAVGRVAGLVPNRRRVLPAAGLGGVYAVLCALPPLAALGGFWGQALAAMGLVAMAYGRRRGYPRLTMLFFMISCTLGGILMAVLRLVRENGGLDLLKTLNWKVFLLVGAGTYFLLSVPLRGSARQAVAGELLPVELTFRGRKLRFNALLDTGHTLSDPVTGEPVLTVFWQALERLWTPAERRALESLGENGPAAVLPLLTPGDFRLLPYRAVGVDSGLLLCFTAEDARLNGRDLGRLSVALAPEALSETGGYAALWGGGERREDRHAA